MDKRSRYSASVKEKPSSTIVGESVQDSLNAFTAEFLEYLEENEVEPVPEFLIKSISRVPRAKNSLKIKDEGGNVEEGKRHSPVFYLRFESGRKWDSLKEIRSKDKLQNCRINAFGVTIIAKMLVEIGCVKDLNLDMNPNVKENFHLLCSSAGNLMYLSLKLCEISDAGVEKIADELEYKDPPNTSKLLALNLANNRLTEVGAGHIARMLRTNRSLESLDLCGNRIHDEGASLIIQELSMSMLTHSEIVEKRRRRFAELIMREEENRVKESTSGQWMIIKPRKKSSLSQRSKKSLHRVPSASFKTDDHSLNSARSTNEKSSTFAADVERHPFNSETLPFQNRILACGNLQLQHLNFSFCGLTAKSLKRLIECLYYQTYMTEGDTSKGLLHVSIEGNTFPETISDWMKLNELLRLRCARKSTSSMEDYEKHIPKEAPILRNAIRQRDDLISQFGDMYENLFKNPLHRVFVYGTLKRGEPNHGLIQGTTNGYAKFLGLARTTVAYPLIIATKYNIPFLLKKPDMGYHVLGEVYDVDTKMLKRLDELEEHPNLYERSEDTVLWATEAKLKANNNFDEVGALTKVWIYFLPKFRRSLLDQMMYKSYSSKGGHGLKYCEKYVRDPSHDHRKEVLSE